QSQSCEPSLPLLTHELEFLLAKLRVDDVQDFKRRFTVLHNHGSVNIITIADTYPRRYFRMLAHRRKVFPPPERLNPGPYRSDRHKPIERLSILVNVFGPGRSENGNPVPKAINEKFIRHFLPAQLTALKCHLVLFVGFEYPQ